jgi:hypothetical protein
VTRIAQIGSTRGDDPRQRLPRHRVYGPLSSLGDLIIRLGLVAIGIMLLYISSIIATGALARFPVGPGGIVMSAADQEQFRHIVEGALLILQIAVAAVVFCAILRYHDVDGVAWGIGAFGLLCWVGIPYLVKVTMRGAAPENLLPARISGEFVQTGLPLLVVWGAWVALSAAVNVVRGLRVPRGDRAPKAKRTAKVAATPRPSMLRRCWELSRCRDYLQQSCPAFQEKRPCWKRGSGCFCDPHLAKQLLDRMDRSSRGEVIAAVTTQQRMQQVAKQAAAFQAKRAGAAGAPRCGDCPIYVEHQDYKYRAVAWLAYPAAALLIVFFRRSIHVAYVAAMTWLEKAVGMLQLLPSTAPRDSAEGLLNSPLEWVIIGILSVLLVSYFLRFIEHAIFSWKV